MSDLRGVARLKIDDGRLEDFKRMAVEVLDIVREKDKGTLQYDMYFNEDETECVFLEHFVDSQAVVDHNKSLGDLLWDMLGTGTVTAELFGEPNPELKEMLKNTPNKVYHHFRSI